MLLILHSPSNPRLISDPTLGVAEGSNKFKFLDDFIDSAVALGKNVFDPEGVRAPVEDANRILVEKNIDIFEIVGRELGTINDNTTDYTEDVFMFLMDLQEEGLFELLESTGVIAEEASTIYEAFYHLKD